MRAGLKSQREGVRTYDLEAFNPVDGVGHFATLLSHLEFHLACFADPM
jgi:hypothetical protein